MSLHTPTQTQPPASPSRRTLQPRKPTQPRQLPNNLPSQQFHNDVAAGLTDLTPMDFDPLNEIQHNEAVRKRLAKLMAHDSVDVSDNRARGCGIEQLFLPTRIPDGKSGPAKFPLCNHVAFGLAVLDGCIRKVVVAPGLFPLVGRAYQPEDGRGRALA